MQSTSASGRARQPPRRYLAVIRAIDGITRWTGYLFTLLVVPLVIANVVEVFMRYVMNSPTSWALDVTTMSFGALFMLGAAYALLKGAHVRTDMLWEKFSDRKKGMIDSVAYLLFFLPSMAILFCHFDRRLLLFAVDQREIDLRHLAAGDLAAPGRDPPRCGAAVPAGHSELMKSLWAARTGEMLVHHEKIEV